MAIPILILVLGTWGLMSSIGMLGTITLGFALEFAFGIWVFVALGFFFITLANWRPDNEHR